MGRGENGHINTLYVNYGGFKICCVKNISVTEINYLQIFSSSDFLIEFRLSVVKML